MNSSEVSRFSRRTLLRSAAATAAASSMPDWFLNESEAATMRKRLGPNDQPAIALVGCGGMGRADAKSASRFGRVVALCDVDEARIAEAKNAWPDAKSYRDFRDVMARDDIHVVVCGTVDHWHTLVSLAALRSGKDVYCEKPLTLTIDEGKRLVKAVKKSQGILQTGSQQRSDKRFRLACELVRNGRIGKLKHIDVWLPAGLHGGPFAEVPVPAGMDWNLWQGPVVRTPYVKEKAHGTFRYWWDYSGGTMTDWGAHHNDIALWALGLTPNGPVEVEGRALKSMIPGGYTAASEYEIQFKYANGVTQTTRSTADDTFSGGVVNKDGQRHGVRFHGTEGWIWVTRGDIQASNPEMLATPLEGGAIRLAASDDHMKNFFDCLRSRQAPICEAEVGHRSATVCHLGVIALRLGRKLKWNPRSEKFEGDREANRWLAREYRNGYDYGMV